MSDIRLFNLKKNKDLKRTKLLKYELQDLIERNALELLGVTIVFSNINITNKNGEIVESLGYDEDRRIVVIEYHTSKFGQTINKGLEYLDYIRQNIGKIKVLFKEKLGDSAKELIYDPRLIAIGEEYTEYDGKAISFLPFDIDLIKCMVLDKEIVLLEKIYQNFVGSSVKFSDDINLNRLYNLLDDAVYSLSDEVSKSFLNGCVSYRRIKNFMYIYYQYGLYVVLKNSMGYKKYLINTNKDIEKLTPLIEAAYDEN